MELPGERRSDGWKDPMLRLVVGAALTAALAASPDLLSSSGPGAGPVGWRSKIERLADRSFKHPAWGASHARRDYELAKSLAAADHKPLDDDVLYAAALLHDMAAFPPWEKTGVDHADRAADLVDSVLTGTGFPMAKVNQVKDAIRTHMFDRDPAAPEAVYLHDADALDWLGAIGVARTIALADENGGAPTLDDVVKSLQQYVTAVPGRIVSPGGRAVLKERLPILQKFLADLARDTAKPGTL